MLKILPDQKKMLYLHLLRGKIKNRKRTYHLRLERKDMDAFSNSLLCYVFSYVIGATFKLFHIVLCEKVINHSVG